MGESLTEVQQAASKANPFGQLKAAVEALFLFLAEHPCEARILIVESSGLNGRLEAVRKDLLGSQVRYFETALVAMGSQLPRMRTPMVAWCLLGAVYQAAWWWLEQSEQSRPLAEAVAVEVAAFDLRGIGWDAATLAAAETVRGSGMEPAATDIPLPHPGSVSVAPESPAVTRPRVSPEQPAATTEESTCREAHREETEQIRNLLTEELSARLPGERPSCFLCQRIHLALDGCPLEWGREGSREGIGRLRQRIRQRHSSIKTYGFVEHIAQEVGEHWQKDRSNVL